MLAWHRLGIRWRHPRTEEGDSPEIIPPIGIILFVPGSAVWLMVTILYSLAWDLSTWGQIGAALFGGVAPIAIAYGITTNKRWTRIAIVLALAGTIWSCAALQGMPISARMEGAWLASLGWLVIVFYLYAAKGPRTYYHLIAGKPLPSELRGVDLTPPKWIEVSIGNLAAVSEWLLIIIALGIFIGAFFGLFDYLLDAERFWN